MMKILTILLHDETGAALTEYAILLALVAVTVLGALSMVRDEVIAVFNQSNSNLKTIY